MFIPVSFQGKAAELEDGLKQLSSVSTELEEVKGTKGRDEKWKNGEREMWGRITNIYYYHVYTYIYIIYCII